MRLFVLLTLVVTSWAACTPTATSLGILTVSSASAPLPAPFKIPACVTSTSTTLTATVGSPYEGVVLTTFQGSEYKSAAISLTGTVSQINSSLSSLFFVQTTAGLKLQTILYTLNTTDTALSNTLYINVSGIVASSPTTFASLTTTSVIIITQDEPTRKSKIYKVIMNIAPSDYTNAKALGYLQAITRCMSTFISIVDYSFTSHKFAPQQQTQTTVSYQYVGLSSSQESVAVGNTETNCQSAVNSGSANVDCSSFSTVGDSWKSPSSGLTGGAIVGILIGSVAMSLIIAACIALIVLKMQTTPSPNNYADKDIEGPTFQPAFQSDYYEPVPQATGYEQPPPYPTTPTTGYIP